MKKLIVDVGSSTVKIYKVEKHTVVPVLQKSFHFKTGFDANVGISPDAEKELLEMFETLGDSNPGVSIKIYATGIFRKLTDTARTAFVDRFFLRTGLFFNVISQEIESFYLEKALVGKCALAEPVLLINIGGGSTELVVMYGSEAIERHNLEGLGVGSITTEFPGINGDYSDTPLKKVMEFVVEKLPVIKNRVRYAVYNGGELTYMRLAKYELEKNSIFEDADHPSMIGIKKIRTGNERVFSKVTLKELEELMPQDPKWMHGARPCSAIAQAIIEHFGVQYVVPSDSNTAHGMARQEFRHVTISGSFRKHLDYVLKIKQRLTRGGVRILSPRFEEPKNPGETFVVFRGEEGFAPLELERHHLKSIDESDALVVCDPKGYVGASALIEIGYAQSKGKRIVFTEKPEEFMLNTLPAEIGI